jgi:hypothetical protein
MAGFFATLFHPSQIEDGTRRAAIESVANATDDLDAATARLTKTIDEMLRENDRANKRRRKDEGLHRQ